jgi:hypothetical protein
MNTFEEKLMSCVEELFVDLGQASLLTKGTGVQYWEGHGTDFYTYLD